MATQDFQVLLSSGNVTPGDWGQAMDAAELELPRLTEAQREAARIIGMAEKEYARGVLASNIGKERQRGEGKRLGSTIAAMIEKIGPDCRLESLVRGELGSAWIARIEALDANTELEIPADLADGIVDTGDSPARRRLEKLLQAGLNHRVRRAV